jgi:hypothetical protein
MNQPVSDATARDITDILYGEALLLDDHTASWVVHLPPLLREAASHIDRLTAERDRLRAALRNIVESSDAASELYSSDRQWALNLYDQARAALAATSPRPDARCPRCGGARTVRFGAPCPECSADRGEWGAATPPPAR